jgi:hypothetical protein
MLEDLSTETLEAAKQNEDIGKYSVLSYGISHEVFLVIATVAAAIK